MLQRAGPSKRIDLQCPMNAPSGELALTPPKSGWRKCWRYAVLFALRCPRTPFLDNFRFADNTSDNKVLPLRPQRDYGSTSRPSVIRPLPVRWKEQTRWQALYQASPPPSSAQEKWARGRSICGSDGLERFWSGF